MVVLWRLQPPSLEAGRAPFFADDACERIYIGPLPPQVCARCLPWHAGQSAIGSSSASSPLQTRAWLKRPARLRHTFPHVAQVRMLMGSAVAAELASVLPLACAQIVSGDGKSELELALAALAVCGLGGLGADGPCDSLSVRFLPADRAEDSSVAKCGPG